MSTHNLTEADEEFLALLYNSTNDYSLNYASLMPVQEHVQYNTPDVSGPLIEFDEIHNSVVPLFPTIIPSESRDMDIDPSVCISH